MHSTGLAASGQIPRIPADWPGWLVIGIVALLLARWLLRLLGILK
jgi:hypothetical protein